MNERDFKLLMRAKRQIDRESAWRSFLWVGLIVAALLRMVGVELPFLYLTLFSLLFVLLILSSDLLTSLGSVSKKELVSLIENHIHHDPDTLTRYSSSRSRSSTS